MTAMLLSLVGLPMACGISLVASGEHRRTRTKTLTNFSEYMALYGRNYHEGSQEFSARQALYQQRLHQIRNQNSRRGRLWTAGVSKLTDRTEEELSAIRGYRHVRGGVEGAALLSESVEVYKKRHLKETVDWKTLSMASDVPDQGACGSCWAVATSVMLQARSSIMLNTTRTFSTQQLVNCVPNPQECGGTGGCQGATVELAMTYVERMGLESDESDPYTASDMTCRQPVPSNAGSSNVGSFLQSVSNRLRHSVTRGQAQPRNSIGLTRWQKLPENKALPLMVAVNEGPVAISVAAADWALYMNGIFDGCSKDAVVDHAVTLFGYGEENGAKYWTVRNSWGSLWGEDGYIRLLRQDTADLDDDWCGTDSDPSAGLACKPYPKSARVCGMCGMLYDSVSAHFSASEQGQ